MTRYSSCMTLISFRVADDDAAQLRRWADRLGLDRSELLRTALRRHLAALAAEGEVEQYRRHPITDDEASLAAIADWGPAEDWSDWA